MISVTIVKNFLNSTILIAKFIKIILSLKYKIAISGKRIWGNGYFWIFSDFSHCT